MEHQRHIAIDAKKYKWCMEGAIYPIYGAWMVHHYWVIYGAWRVKNDRPGDDGTLRSV